MDTKKETHVVGVTEKNREKSGIGSVLTMEQMMTEAEKRKKSPTEEELKRAELKAKYNH